MWMHRALVRIYQQLFSSPCRLVSSEYLAALTLYEYLLTFNAERRVIWGRKLTLPSMLFLLNRYSLWLFSMSTILWNLVDWDTNKVKCSE